MARPKLDIDPTQVRKLASIGCTHNEIADIVGCSHDTLTNRFKREIEQGRADGKASLRRKQFELAMGGNAALCIWLGKQLLGQTDKVSNTTTAQTKITIDLTDNTEEEVVTSAEIVTKQAIN